MKTRTLVAAALAALLFPLAASAQDDPRLDRDRLETGAPTELPPPANPEPPPVDPRVPTAEQLEEPMTTPPEPDVPPPDVDPVPLDPTDRWGQLDADGDGRISAEEGRIDADFHSNFSMMDTDSDGFVDDTELDRAGGEGTGGEQEGNGGGGAEDGDRLVSDAADRDDHTEVVSRDPEPADRD